MGRVLTWVLEVGWVIAWALHFGAGWDLAVMPLAAVVAAVVRRRSTWAVAAWTLALATGALTGGPWGIALVALALWRGASPPNRDSPAVYERVAFALVGTAMLAVAAPPWAWTLPVAVAVGLLTALEVNRGPDTNRAAHIRLAGTLALLGAAAGLAVVAVVALVPISLAFPAIHAMLTALGHFAVFVLNLITHGRGGQKVTIVPVGRHRPAKHSAAPVSSIPLWVYVVGAALFVLLVALAQFTVQRLASTAGDGGERVQEGQLERERLGTTVHAHGVAPRTMLTRRVLQVRMRRAAQHQRGPLADETVREWMTRRYGAAATGLASLYEDVRYGGIADDVQRARTVDRSWPVEAPVQNRPTQTDMTGPITDSPTDKAGGQ
jgi:hypothetical protein